MTYIREPASPRGWWPPFLVGAATGLLAGVLLGRGGEDDERRGRREARDEDRWSRWRETWDSAVDQASGGLAAAREVVSGGPVEVDAADLERRVEGMACATECRVRLLGNGIVELVGDCASEEDARALLDAVAAEPGVEVVVNRVWTPASGDPDAARP